MPQEAQNSNILLKQGVFRGILGVFWAPQWGAGNILFCFHLGWERLVVRPSYNRRRSARPGFPAWGAERSSRRALALLRPCRPSHCDVLQWATGGDHSSPVPVEGPAL